MQWGGDSCNRADGDVAAAACDFCSHARAAALHVSHLLWPQRDEMTCDGTFDLRANHVSLMEHLQLDTSPISSASVAVIRSSGVRLQLSRNRNEK